MKRIFISDLHIGDDRSKWYEILIKLSNESFDELYLLGDIFDLWLHKYDKIKRENFAAIQLLNKLAERVHVYYIIGNHDEEIIKYRNDFDRIIFTDSSVIDGKIKIIHGNEYDFLMEKFYFGSRIVAKISNVIYKLFKIKCCKISLSNKKHSKQYLKLMNIIKMKAYELNKNFMTLIMGHTHLPANEKIGNMLYLNCGDWVDSFSYIVEENGKFELNFMEELCK